MSCFSSFFGIIIPQEDCHSIDFASSVRMTQEVPVEGLHRYLELPQLRFQTFSKFNNAYIRTRTDGIRSASDGSYIGIEGETMVWAIHRAQFGYSQEKWGIYAGIIDDLWVLGQNTAWGNRNQSLGLAERNDWQPRSDVGLGVNYLFDKAYIQLQITTGEGHQYAERNNGFSTQLLCGLRLPQHDLIVFGQEGSKGSTSAMNHRVGMRFSSSSALHYGLEVIKTWGIGGDSTLAPLGTSLWLAQRAQKGMWGFVRADFIHQNTPSQLEGWMGFAWGFSPALHVVLATEQTYAWNSGYASSGTQQWQQSYYIQLQFEQHMNLFMHNNQGIKL